MSEFDKLSNHVLASLRKRLTKVLPLQIRACIEQLDEDQLWWRPNEHSNSAGNLVLHISGALLHFVARGIGGFEYHRDRPTEFSEQSSMPKEQLLATFDEAIEKVGLTLDKLDAAKLCDPSTETGYYDTVLEVILGATIHFTVHAGQIVYITKILKENALNELWMETHFASGMWK